LWFANGYLFSCKHNITIDVFKNTENIYMGGAWGLFGSVK